MYTTENICHKNSLESIQQTRRRQEVKRSEIVYAKIMSVYLDTDANLLLLRIYREKPLPSPTFAIPPRIEPTKPPSD